jgi:N-acetylmuramoyl-L-alanine amidase
MKLVRLFTVCILTIFIFSGCKTTQKIQSNQKIIEGISEPTGELRGFVVMPESWINVDDNISKKNITTLIGKLADANYNAVFFFAKLRFDLLDFALNEAHKQNLKFYAGFDLSDPDDLNMKQSLPLVKTYLRKMVNKMVSTFDIDGLSLVSSENNIDLVEIMVVEAMLVKPYLVNSIVYSGEDEFRFANNCLKEGIADLIIPKTGTGVDPSANPNRYSDKKAVPLDLKKTTPEQIIGLDLSAIFPENPSEQKININRQQKIRTTDSEGNISLILPKHDTISLNTSKGNLIVTTENWFLPYKYSVQTDNKIIRRSPWVEFRAMPKGQTDLAEYDFLCKTEYPASVKINGDSLKLYKTGIFFKKVSFNEGVNRVRASARMKDSVSVFYEPQFIYAKIDKIRKPFPLWIDEKSVAPNTDLELLREDNVRISFQGSLGQEGYIEVKPGGLKIKCSRQDQRDYSLYMTDLPLQKLSAGKSYKMILKIIPSEPKKEKGAIEVALKNSIIVRNAEDFPLVKIVRDNARLTYNTGEPRLGGPIRAELGKGVVMKINGKIGNNYRIRLSRVENGIINKNDVAVLPSETVQPSYFISDMSCGPSKDADVLSIPYLEPVPYEIYPDRDQKRLVVTLFGVESSSTWITHREGRKIIDKVTWNQTTPETYQIYVNLKTSNIWGYDLRPDGKRLVLRIKYPPVYELNNEKPLTGLKIAIEAGHGGTGMGAIGLSGLIEKDINLDLSLKLGELCKSMGAEVIQVRDSDKDMTLIEKRNIPISLDADLLVCIHANAGGRGYLSVSGTSTYYNNPFWAPMAESIYRRLLQLGLNEFGVVGSFNYTVIRVTQMPSILVEQAFMTNAEDEEKLADPQFRQQEAQKIYEGIIDYLKYMKQ